MQIDTFYLTPLPKKTDLNILNCANLNKINIELDHCQLTNLKNAASWAIENKVDAILVISKKLNPISFNFDQVFKTVNKLYGHGIYIFGLTNSKTERKQISVTEGLCVTNRWYQENSWIILKPLFQVILDLNLKQIEETIKKYPTVNYILNLLGHTKFTFIKQTKYSIKESRINVIIPFRNVEKYIESCIQSITEQRYKNYRVFFIDDSSEDNSFSLIPNNKRFFKIKNRNRKYALENIINGLLENKFKKCDIICLVDGDDKLSHPYVFNILNQIYSLENPEITYGSFRYINQFFTFGSKYTRKEFDRIRKAPWKASHLKTFKYSLFEKYRQLDPNLSHFKDFKGFFFKMPYDMAIMFPLLEVAGYNNSRFIDLPLYLYRLHENNDHIQSFKIQQKGEIELREKKKPIHQLLK